MLKQLEGLPTNVVGVEASGTVTKDDYETVLEPIVDAARREGRRLRFLYQFGPEFEHFSGGAAWEDARVGLGSMRTFEACAIVTDVGWLQKSVGFVRLMMPCPVRVFDNAKLDDAVAWLESLPAGEGVHHRLLPDLGVLVVEPKGPLRAADFDALALVVDPWIASHGQLHGLVIHAADFPGWEGLGDFVRHVRFIHDHQRKIGRIALAADIELANIAPKIAEHFVEAEVRHFGYDQLDEAIAWAGDAGSEA